MKDLNKKFDALWKDLNSVKNVEKAPKISNVLLYKEFRRRMEIWKNEVAKTIFKGKKTSLELGQNLLEVLVPQISAGFKDFNEFRRIYLKNTTIGASRKILDSKYIYYYIYWEILKEKPEIKQFDYLPHPYSLVIDLIKRGGSIYHVEMSFYNISGMDFSVKNALKQPLPSVDIAFLDFIDKHCGNSSADIPDDNEIALLWSEFNNNKQSDVLIQ